MHQAVNSSSHAGQKRVCRDLRGPSFSEVAQLYKQPLNQSSNLNRQRNNWSQVQHTSSTTIATITPAVNSNINQMAHQQIKSAIIQSHHNQTIVQSHLKCIPGTHEPSINHSSDEEDYSRPASFLINHSLHETNYDSEAESFLDSADESSDEESKTDQPINPSIVHPLAVAHSWSDIVQKDLHPSIKQSTNHAITHSFTQSARIRSPRTPSGRRTKRGRRSITQSINYSPAAVNFLQTYQLNHQSAHIAHQKHIDRAARCSHDMDCSRDQVINILSCVLDQLFPLRATDVLPSDVSLITLFHTERVPSIPISAYLGRLAQYTEVSSEVLIHALIHLNRLIHSRPNFVINSLNIHRLWLTSMLCSAKFFDDVYYNNAYFAKVGGIPNKELNDLEIEFLALINFDLFIDYNVYASFYNELCASKLHTSCKCQLHNMPPINPAYYARPAEVEDEQHSNIVDLSSEDSCDLDSLDSISVSSSRRGSWTDSCQERANSQLNARMRKERSRKRASATSYSPATTASTNSFCSAVDSGVSSTEEDDDDDSTEEDDHDDDDIGVAPKLIEAGVLSKQVSSASTLSVSLAIDCLQVDGHVNVNMSDSPCSSARRVNPASQIHQINHILPTSHNSSQIYQINQSHPSTTFHHPAHSGAAASFASQLPLHPYTHALLFAPPPTSHPTHMSYAQPPTQGAIVQAIM